MPGFIRRATAKEWSERPLRAGCQVLGHTNVAEKAHDERGEQCSQAGAVVRLGLVLFFDSGDGVMRQIVREVKISTRSITGSQCARSTSSFLEPGAPSPFPVAI